MWQKARVVKSRRQEVAHLIGREVWVYGAPRFGPSMCYWSGELLESHAKFDTNLRQENGEAVSVRTESVELIPEFSDTVALVPLAEWLATTAH